MNETPIPMAFEALFRDLVRAFQPRHLERETCGVYWAVLGARYPLATLQQAALRLAVTQRFFPTTGEWGLAAAALADDEDRRSVESCDWCADRGLVRVMYHSGEPFDVAICRCASAHFFRRIGDGAFAVVRRHLQLDEAHEIGWLEEFFEDEAALREAAVSA